MATIDPFEKARSRKRRIGRYLVVVGAFLALREIVEGGPITDPVTLVVVGVAVALIAWGRYLIVSNPKRPF